MFNTNPWLYYSTTSNKLTNTYIQGILDICGNIVLRNGGFSLPNGDLSMNGNLYVGLDTTMIGNVNIQGNLVVNKRVLQTLSNDPSYNNVNGYYALAKQVQPIVSTQTSYDIGQNWVRITSGTTSGIISLTWRSVCWSPQLRIFCAVSKSGTGNQRVMISSDGYVWRNAITSDISNNQWNSVCWAAEIGKFCAVAITGGTNDRVMVSSDGLNWTPAISGVTAYSWYIVCWAAEIGKFCAVADNAAGNNSVMVSSDGLNWTSATSGVINFQIRTVCWSPELGIFCLLGYGVGDGPEKVCISRDGLIWTNAGATGLLGNLWTGVCWSPELGIFCAVSNNSGGYSPTIMISRDGLNWTNNNLNITNYDATYNLGEIIWASELGLFMTVSYSNGTFRVLISRDGSNWIAKDNGLTGSLYRSLCWSPELSIFCLISEAGNHVHITNPVYRLPTTKSLKTLLNDGNYNINIASTSSGTFPNFRTTATGPNLISIGNGNYKLVAGTLLDSIAIGNTILNASNPNGYGMIGMGQNVFPALTTGFQNIGIGNAIATSMTTGYNNVFIGNGVATSVSSTGNTVAIGSGAGRGLTTGINNTFLGRYTNTSSGTFSNSTALGYDATITASNQIKLGTSSERVDISGNLNVSGLASFIGYLKPNIVGFNYIRITTATASIATGTLIQLNNASYFNSAVFDSGHVANGFFTAPVSGYYVFHCNLWCATYTGYTMRINAATNGDGEKVCGGYTATNNSVAVSSTTMVKLDVNGNVKIYAVNTGVTLSQSNNVSNFIGFLLSTY